MFSLSNYNRVRFLFLFSLLLCIHDYCRAQPPDSPFDSGLGGGNSIIGSVYLPSGQKPGTRMRVRLFTMTRGDLTSMTDDNGKFKFSTTQKLPFTIIISSIGFSPKEVQVTGSGQEINVELDVAYAVGQEIVVAASRVPGVISI